MVMSFEGTRSRECADEGQQQFTRQTVKRQSQSKYVFEFDFLGNLSESESELLWDSRHLAEAWEAEVSPLLQAVA
jgi:hypothetical protein